MTPIIDLIRSIEEKNRSEKKDPECSYLHLRKMVVEELKEEVSMMAEAGLISYRKEANDVFLRTEE